MSHRLNIYAPSYVRELNLAYMNDINGTSFLSETSSFLSFDLRSLANLRADLIVAETDVILKATRNGVVHAVAIWFELTMLEENPTMIISTGPIPCESENQFSHFRQVAVLLKPPKFVQEGDLISFHVLIHSIYGVFLFPVN